MKIHNKKIFTLFMLFSALFILSGCTSPTDKAGNIIRITNDTTFSQIFSSESWFSAIFVFPLSKAINFLSTKVGVAAAIAIVTILVNIVVLAVTLKANIQTQRMQELQPEMDRINKKYADKTDEASNARKVQEVQMLYKKYDINPLGTILTTFIQFPIIIAMFQSVQRSQSVIDGSFLNVSLKQTPLKGITGGNYTYLAIFIIMLIVQIGSMMLPQYLSKRKAIKEAELHHRKPVLPENKNQNMMYAMMLPILVLSLNWPTAMTIYWIINSIVMISKTLFINHVISKQKVGA